MLDYVNKKRTGDKTPKTREEDESSGAYKSIPRFMAPTIGTITKLDPNQPDVEPVDLKNQFRKKDAPS